MSTSPYQNNSLNRGFAVLEQIAANNGSLTLTEIAHRVGMAKPTTKRFLESLMGLGYVTADAKGKTFSISPKILQLGYSVFSSLTWREIAREYMERFYEEIGETISACVLEGSNILYVLRVNKPGFPIIHTVGTARPAYASSMGKILISLKPVDWQTKFINSINFSPITPYTVSSKEALRVQLDAARAQGYALCNQEVSELLRSVAVPILHQEEAVAAINVAVWAEEYTLERLLHEILPKLQLCASQISQALMHMEYRF